MKTKEIISLLTNEGLDFSCFEEHAKTTYRKRMEVLAEYGVRKNYGYTHLDIPYNISSEQFNGVLKACEPFKEYFDLSEYSKLVCEKLLSFSRNQVAVLTSFSQYPELNVCTYASPNKDLPKYLETICNSSGNTKICTAYGAIPQAY